MELSPTFGKTRWKQFAALMALSVVAAAVLGISMARGVIAASFLVSGQKFKVSSDSLVGEGNAVVASVDVEYNGTRVPVMISSFRSATIRNLCESVPVPLGPLGDYTLTLTAGTGATPATARSLFIDLVDLKSSDSTFHQVDTGIAAGALTKGEAAPGGGTPPRVDPNSFAQQATSVTLTDVRLVAVAISAGTFNLPDSHLALRRGATACF